jgi:hypothetical protein
VYTGCMLNDKHFKKVALTEFKPDKDKQKPIDEYVDGKPWVIVSVLKKEDGTLNMEVEGGGGITLEEIPATLANAALAVFQGYSEQEEVD